MTHGRIDRFRKSFVKYKCPPTTFVNRKYSVKMFKDSVKFYIPRVEGYLEILREMASKYRGMSLMEFDGYFEGKFEPVKYTRIEIHTNGITEGQMMNTANRLRLALRQESLAFEFNNKLILVGSADLH